jgi:hypothetical protein
MIIPRLVVLSVSVLAISPDVLAMNVKTYKEMQASDTGRNTVRAYIDGVGEGFGWANIKLDFDGNAKLFCTPPTLTLNNDNFLRILDDEIALNAKAIAAEALSVAPVEFLLLQGLQKTFPCPAKK